MHGQAHLGIVGWGVVGEATGLALQARGHSISTHDIKLDTTLNDLIDCDGIIICTPTPLHGTELDDSTIVDTLLQLDHLEYAGLVCVRSTLMPGRTRDLCRMFPQLTICYTPEFLREHSSQFDAQTQFRQIVGCVEQHEPPWWWTGLEIITAEEAECYKLYSNSYNALLVTFANAWFEICNQHQADYQIVQSLHHTQSYLQVNSQLRGYAGPCLPKDVQATATLAERTGLKPNLFHTVHEDNLKYQPTVKPGMRQE